jgi:Calcineurin-like phosphoesterase
MRIALLQLSDIHFQTHKRFVLSRVSRIVAAACSAAHSWEHMIVLFTGDVANAGLAAEYAIASGFVAELRTAMSLNRPEATIYYFAIPGNHDCDYSTPENATRDLILDSILANLGAVMQPAPLKQLLKAQEHFASFRDSLQSPQEPQNDSERIVQTIDLPFGRQAVRICLLNSAIACRRRMSGDTDQGKLVLPASLLSGDQPTSEVYSIATLHHPLNWLESNNSVEIRHRLSASFDLILTGHQHEEDAASQEWITKDKNLWVSAAALQDSTGSFSGFNLIEVDLDTLQETVTQYKWSASLYLQDKSHVWTKEQNVRQNRRSIPFTPHWLMTLDDPGTGFTHPYKKHLTLQDLYVQPGFDSLLGSVKPTASASTDQMESDFFAALTGSELTILIGEARSGKTTLLRKAVKYLYDSNQGVSPLMLRGSDINKSTLNPSYLWRQIRKEFENQYDNKAFTSFEQLRPSERVLIVDDWQMVELNDSGRSDLLDMLSLSFARILLLTDDSTKLENIEAYTRPYVERDGLAAYRLRPFGHLLRSRLIRKWLLIGREKTMSAEELHNEIHRSEIVLNTVLGRSLLPSYPFFLFSLMQVSQNISTSQHANGSYGYLYESLITMALAEVSKEATEVDVYYTVLGRIAWALRQRGSRACPGGEITKVIEEYGREYKSIIDPALVLKMLLRANILASHDGEYSFKYKYIYYYFLARFLADELKNPATASKARAEMLCLPTLLTREENANIVIFLIYLTRDSDLIEKLLEMARSLFAGVPLFDADKSLEFLAPVVEQVYKDGRPSVGGSPESNRDRERHGMDLSAGAGDEDEEEDDSGPDSEFARAVKLMDILGQVVRNFPGSMPGDRKVEITAEVYSLGLRLASMIMLALEKNELQFRGFLEEAIRSHLKSESREISDEDLSKRVDSLLVVLINVVAFNVMKSITAAVGLKQLRPVYDEVRARFEDTPALRLVDLSLSLDHGASFPKEDILKLHSEFSNKWFAAILLRRFVVYHLRMFHVAPNTAKSIGQRLGIRMTRGDIVAKLASRNPTAGD